MSDHRGLIGKLVELAATDTSIADGWRRVGRALDRDPLAAILREIDETQSPRRLSFRNDKGDVLQLEAGNRRLLRITSVSWTDQSALDAVLAKDLSKLNEDEIGEIGGVLRSFQPGDQTVWVQNESLSTSPESSSNGLPAARLARALSMDLDAYSEENLRSAYEQFVQEQMPQSEAWARIENGEAVEESQPAPAAGWRAGWTSADLTHLENGGASIEDAPTLCILGSGGEQGPHHIVATCGPTSVVLVTHTAQVAEIAQKWRELGL